MMVQLSVMWNLEVLGMLIQQMGWISSKYLQDCHCIACIKTCHLSYMSNAFKTDSKLGVTPSNTILPARNGYAACGMRILQPKLGLF